MLLPGHADEQSWCLGDKGSIGFEVRDLDAHRVDDDQIGRYDRHENKLHRGRPLFPGYLALLPGPEEDEVGDRSVRLGGNGHGLQLTGWGGFQFPVLTPEATLGIAIANDTNTDASCRFVLESPEREELGQAMLQVSSKSNVARFLYEAIQIPDGFTEGSTTVSCDQQVSVIGLQFDGAIFATLPPAIFDKSPQTIIRGGSRAGTCGARGVQRRDRRPGLDR